MGNVCSISIPMDGVVSGCINCTARRAKYVGELEENTTALSTELEELKRIRNDTKRRVEIAEQQQHMKRLEQVQGWLLRVEGFEAQVEKLLTDAQQQMSHKCVGGWCPRPGNYISSYGLGKNVAKKLQEVNVLKTKGTFEIVADKLPLASRSGDERPSEPTVGLESTFDEVCNYIGDEQAGVIGIYGMGGIGKTTLLTQINNKLCNTGQGFDVVIWVTVSKNPNLAKVQDVIGERIGFNGEIWTRKSQEDKEAPLCPNISTLFLGDNKLRMISEDFFQRMPNLRVLDMQQNDNLDVIPMRISKLVTLQYLNLSFTRIVELPIEFKNLVELKVLSLNFTRALRIIPVEVLSSFKKLQVLRMFECDASDLFGVYEKPEFFEHNFLTCCPETFVAELECFKGLNYLEITITTASAFSPFINSPKLQSCIRGKRMENLEIIKQPYFHCLRTLWIKNCPMLKDLTWLIFAPSLEFLIIEACHVMEEVISGHQRVAGEGRFLNPLSNLKVLVLVDLPNLKCIYSDPLAFPCLKNVIVGTNCPKLKKLPFNSNSAKGGRQVEIRGEDEWWNALEWEDEATRIDFLPTFQSWSQLTMIVGPHYKPHVSLKSDMVDLLFTDR